MIVAKLDHINGHERDRRGGHFRRDCVHARVGTSPYLKCEHMKGVPIGSRLYRILIVSYPIQTPAIFSFSNNYK